MPEFPEGYEPELGGLHGFFSELVDQGYSQNGALAAFRDAGGTGANQLLRDAYNMARDWAEARPEGWGQPFGTTPDPASFIEWEAGRAGLYGYPVELQLRTTEGELTMVPSWVYSDAVLSPDDALMAAIDQYGIGMSETDTTLKGDIVGAAFRGVPFAMVGARAA